MPKKRKRPAGLSRSSKAARHMKARRQTEEGQNENAAMSQSARRTRSAGQVEQERERLASRWKNQS
jgi:hypothetical protein